MKKLNLTLLITLLMAGQITAQTVKLDNGVARMDISLSGGIITRMSLNAIDLNPIHQYGHFICFDRWGPSSAADQALGIPWHGNGSKVTWTVLQEPTLNEGQYYTELSCLLPVLNLSMNRKIYLNQQSSVFKVEEEITNLNDGPKVYNLVQHPTIGAPFLDESTIVDTQADSGFSQTGPLPPSPADVFTWPEAMLDGDLTDMRYLAGDHSWSSAVVSFILDEKEAYRWVTALNPSLNLMIGYLWPSADYPWLNLWWNLKNAVPFARGLEFGSTGLHQTWPELLAMDSIFGKQLYTELEAGEKDLKSYYAFLTEIPSDYQGVESVTLEGDSILVNEYGKDPSRSIHLNIQALTTSDKQTVSGNGSELQLKNYPNPFSGETVIDYSLSSGSHVCIEVFNQLGQTVSMLVDEYREKGEHQVSFMAAGLPGGVYLCQLSAGDQQKQQKMIIQN